MSRHKSQAFNLINIEPIGFEMSFPADFKPSGVYDYDLDVESKFDPSNSLVILRLIVEIRSDGFKCVSHSSQFWFDVREYQGSIKKNKDGVFQIPPNIQEKMNSVAISTSRGMIYSALKGTLLHNAILPVVDPAVL